jgi:hypothetical protein
MHTNVIAMPRLPKLQWITRAARKRLIILGIVLAGFCVYQGWVMFHLPGDSLAEKASMWLFSRFVMTPMPGKSYQGPLPPLTPAEEKLRDELKRDIRTLCTDIGERNLVRYDQLNAAADFLEASLKKMDYTVQRQTYEINQKPCHNLEVEIRGKSHPEEIVVVGAHYDSVVGTTGANDNGSGATAVLALARAFRGKEFSRTLRLVEFVNEEPPCFQTSNMGSLVYAARCHERREKIVAMMSLETIGYHSDAKNSQQYPAPFDRFFPSTGNFIAFVGNDESKDLIRKTLASFRKHAQFPSEGVATLGVLTGIGWSDHWSFWQQGYPALMVTDTAPFRYPHYHSPEDTPDKINYDAMSRVVAGLEKVVGDLAGIIPNP